MIKQISIICLLTVFVPVTARGEPQSQSKIPNLKNVLPLLDASSPQALAGVLRGVLITYLPNPLYEDSPRWGEQRLTRRVYWDRYRFRVKKVPRNDGTWRHIRLSSINLPDTLILDVRNVRFPEASRMTFEVYLSFDARGEFTQQNWERGLRLWSGTVRARFRGRLHLHCEATTRLEPNRKSLLPDAVFRLRATKARVSYDNLVYEHVPGIGGSAARVIGKAFHGALKEWHPSLERRLLERANAAIVRSADTREVRISISRAFNAMLRRQK